ncbi:IS110 family transposase [Pseudomonas petrae]|uniref:IS110 family transposase n=1 Tax=Pseudomonas petrae TaxID=2912190 RepID=A0ABS9HYL6_9PSED|nr:IS110 family transposase [Pseudomonas petrae]MCF7531416.1 IS110 family transposase [Pseudomonas petrae]MCF7536974.1 IS110 family transposase [Pseudomonas petrae]MCF7540654.1 IS110 family transposase [Pseudomonas petrae]MCF7558999.1 IS110 family transposase [Pseudomonas petrae]
MPSFVGIDVAKNTFDIATHLPNGKHKTKAKLANDLKGFKELEAWLDKQVEPSALIVMEATSVYHLALAEFVYNKGYRVCVVNPATTHAYAGSELRRIKTDKSDAKLIADFAREKNEKLKPWAPEPLKFRQLKALVRRLDDLQEMEQMELNRLDVSDEKVKSSINSVLSHIGNEIAETHKAIKKHIDDDPDMREMRDLIVTIDGIGQRTLERLLAELGDLRKYNDPRQLVAAAGLNPKLQDSGLLKGRTVISKVGSSRLRACLYMPGLVALKHNNGIKALKERLKANGKAPKQIVCAAMRKLLHYVYGVLKSGQPFDPKLALAQ